MFRKILVPLDGSPVAEEALPYALHLIREMGGELVLLHVVTPVIFATPMHNMATADVWTTIYAQQQEEGAAYLAEVARREDVASFHPEVLVQEGRVADVILSTVENQAVDTIVMATHGRGGITRWVLGSEADRIVRHSPVPVLLVRVAEEDARTANVAPRSPA
jgi:nucleotide-binding universal stress UspA family protein